MARIRNRPIPWPEKDEISNYKDLRRGAADDAFWDEDELVDHQKKGKYRKKPKAGCAGNDGGQHVYVWIPCNRYDEAKYDYFYSWYMHDYEVNVCAGCLKRKPRRSLRRKVN